MKQNMTHFIRIRIGILQCCLYYTLLLLLLSQLFKPLLGRTRSQGRWWAAIRFSSSRTVRPCSPWGGRWIGHWRTIWLTVCSSAPHSQAAEEAIPHLYKHERKRPTPVRRWLNRTQALLGRVIPGGWVPVSGMKVRRLVGLFAHSAFHWCFSTLCYISSPNDLQNKIS